MSQNDTPLPSGTGTPCPVCGNPIPPAPRYALLYRDHHYLIRDQTSGLNVFFLAESGFGPKTSDLELAERVVRFLNETQPSLNISPGGHTS